MVQSDGLRLLLVDDDPAIIRAYGTALTRHGVSVETASNGKEAAERVKSGSFNIDGPRPVRCRAWMPPVSRETAIID